PNRTLRLSGWLIFDACREPEILAESSCTAVSFLAENLFCVPNFERTILKSPHGALCYRLPKVLSIAFNSQQAHYHRQEVIRMHSSNRVNSLTEGVSRLDFDDDMGPGDCQIMECKCGMPLCICVAPSQSTNTPNPQPTRAPVALPQSDPKTKSDTSAKSKGSTSSSNARLALNPGLDNPQRDYEVNGEGLREAIKNGDIAGVKKLLKETALFNKTDIALMLMEHGASLEDKNAQGETPVDCAPATLQYKMREKMEKMMST
ncbi:hypothetical protein EUTSA_v10002200mg, partial [Eutrema salsugineum]